jgi:DNA-binding protein Fis
MSGLGARVAPAQRLPRAAALADAVAGEFRRLAETQSGLVDAEIVSDVERLLAREALTHEGGNQVRAARLLGISRNTLRKRLREGEQ